jgi:hypothetical protein
VLAGGGPEEEKGREKVEESEGGAFVLFWLLLEV